ncbi:MULTISPECIES: DUF6538 domain-containing protein [Paraburkholderia]|uniref:DUF6538 domain-containing protein n=1 Tax=Paraburkholderia podalyriae TaxID=1938811 RepID=A0ABR7PQL2_9BURK|nr:DUF6538 domain-containing protein [Paraburkholderia podalyriae]MBC8748554.1 hypothetical protein [Paraburkholderia podalyriae]
MSVTLIPHPGGRSRNWYVDIHVPASLQDVAGTDRIRRSTRTADRIQAKAEGARIEAEVRAEWQRLWESVERTNTAPTVTRLTHDIIRSVCATRLRSWVHSDDQDRFGRGIDDEELAELEAFGQQTDAEMRSVLAQGKASQNWEHAVELVWDFMMQEKYDVDPSDPLFPELMRRFADVERQAQKVIAARNAGELADFPQPAASAGACLSQMVEPYRAHRTGTVQPKSVSKDVAIWHRLIGFLGDVPLDSVSSADLYRFLDARLRTDDQPWSQGYVDGHAQRALRAIFALARTHGRMTAPNPVAALETTPRLPKAVQAARRQPRLPLKAAQLTTLFASDWYDPGATHWTGRMRTDLAGRYWVPLLMMAHGLRVREPLQLVSSDFEDDGGTWMMTVRTAFDDAGDAGASPLPERSVKNAATARTVPVHPLLLALGFGRFVESLKSAHHLNQPLFPSALPAPGGKAPMWGRAFEQAFLRHLRDRLGFGAGYGNHSFRHQLEDRIRDAQARHGTWPPGLASFYTGRKLTRDEDRAFILSQGSAGDYGDGFQPVHLLPFSAQITFDDVVLPPPFEQWLRP